MAGGLGPAYGQTDVMHDRSYLISSLANPNKAIRKQAEIALADLDRQEALQQRDQYLQQQNAHFEASQRRIIAHQNAMAMDKQLKIDRDTEIDEQGHGLLLSMMQLDAAKRRGEISKDQHDQGILDAASQFPLGLRHPEAKRHLEFITKEADRQNEFIARRRLSEATKAGAKYGISPQIDPETGLPSVEYTRQAALQTPNGRNEVLNQMNTEMAHKYGITTGVGSLFNPVAPHVGTDETGKQIENPTHVAIPFVDQKTGTIGKLPVPTQLFNQMKRDFQDRYSELNQSNSPSPARAAPTVTTPAAIPQPEAWNIPGVSEPVPQATIAPAETPTPTHLGKFNPATGEFE